MSWLANLKMAQKLMLSSAFCAMLTLLVSGNALTRMERMNKTAEMLNNDTVAGLKGIVRLVDDIKQFRLIQYRHILDAHAAQTDAPATEIQATHARIDQDFAVYEKSVNQAEDRANVQELKNRWNAYLESVDAAQAAGRRDNFKQAAVLMSGTAATRFTALNEMLERMNEWNGKQGDKLAHEAKSAYQSGYEASSVIMVIVMIVNIFTGWLLSKLITRPLARVSERMERLRSVCVTNLGNGVAALAQGDLTVHVETGTEPLDMPTKDEFGTMAKTFNGMLEQTHSTVRAFNEACVSLRGLIDEVAQNAESVSLTSTQLSSSADQTSKATTEITHSIQEVAHAAGQAAKTSQEMANGSEQLARSSTEAAVAMENLKEAVSLVNSGMQHQQTAAVQMASATQQAYDLSQSGGQAVEETVTRMERIKEQVETSAQKVLELGRKGREIGDIVQTIDQIAEQTNLLALNAAIEAARAGEHGKGFAVVADEVRKLAERAASATKEIGGLIGGVRAEVEHSVQAMETSRQEVIEGAAMSQQAGSALAKIFEAVQALSMQAEAVRMKAEENEQVVQAMAGHSERVSGAIMTVAAISQETAAGAEELSASAEEVSASAQSVSAAVQEQNSGIEEVNAAAHDLNDMAARLKEQVAQFKLTAAAKPTPAVLLAYERLAA